MSPKSTSMGSASRMTALELLDVSQKHLHQLIHVHGNDDSDKDHHVDAKVAAIARHRRQWSQSGGRSVILTQSLEPFRLTPT